MPISTISFLLKNKLRYYGVALLQKQDVAARRIAKVITLTEIHDGMRAQYNAGKFTSKTENPKTADP